MMMTSFIFLVFDVRLIPDRHFFEVGHRLLVRRTPPILTRLSIGITRMTHRFTLYASPRTGYRYRT